jgi:hypothetical protein
MMLLGFLGLGFMFRAAQSGKIDRRAQFLITS